MVFRTKILIVGLILLLIVACVRRPVIVTPGNIPMEKAKADSAISTVQITSPLDSIISAIGNNAVWSIKIEDLNTGEVVFKRNSEKSLIPASGAKLFTSASALRFLGGDHRFETVIITDGKTDKGGVLQGNLYIIGTGDPTFNRDFPPAESNAKTIFQQWSNMLKAKGVSMVAGDVVCVDTFFLAPRIEPTWEYGDLQERYAVLSGALSYGFNYIELEIINAGDRFRYNWNPPLTDLKIAAEISLVPDTVKTKIDWDWITPDTNVLLKGNLRKNNRAVVNLKITAPAQFFARALQLEFSQNGIKVLGQIRPFNPLFDTLTTANFDTLLLNYSPPLREIVKKINTNSINFYAEQVFRTVGHYLYGEGSIESGIRAVDSLLNETGIDTAQVRLVDGCGLSRHNWISAEALVSLLRYCKNSHYAEDLCNSLAQYGQGTLKTRQPLAENLQVFAKTGSMEGVRSFSGYMLTGEKEYVFSLICNNYACSFKEVESAMDNILAEVARGH